MTSQGKIDMDQLEIEAQRLLGLLRDRQPGLMTWRIAFDATIKAIIDETGYHDYQPAEKLEVKLP